MISITSVRTFTVTIWLGLKKGYMGPTYTLEEVEKVCQDYCDIVGLCVSITPTRFIYTKGNENGCAIGLINYPRFPADPGQIKSKAYELAEKLKERFGQYRVTVVSDDETFMIGDEE